MLRKCLSSILLATALCSGTAYAGDVRFVVPPYSSETEPFFKEVEKDFEAANPGINLVLEFTSWETLNQKLTTDIAAGSPPDLALIGTRSLTDYAAQGVAEPLDAHMTPAFKDVFIESFFSPSMIDGKLMGLPFAASARAMIVNKELFEKAGAKPPTTWDEFMGAARQISKLPGTYGFGLQGQGVEVDAYYFYALFSFGGRILKEDGMSALNSPEAIAAAQSYKQLIDDGATQPTPTSYGEAETFALFKQGKVGMVFTFPMLIPQIKKEAPNLKYEVLPIPVKTASATYGITDTLMMFSGARSKDEAWKVIEFLYQDKYRAAFDEREGLLPVTKAVAASDYYQKDPDMKAFTALLPVAHFAPLIPNFDQIADITVRALQRVYLGEETSEVALNRAATEIDVLRKK